jgi:hypothetical protein
MQQNWIPGSRNDAAKTDRENAKTVREEERGVYRK